MRPHHAQGTGLRAGFFMPAASVDTSAMKRQTLRVASINGIA